MLAGYYIRQIRKVQQSGPYLIGGYSFGGFPAYEMACQLESQGEHVALLWLVDSDARSLPKYVAEMPRTRLWADQLRHWVCLLQFHSAALGQLRPSQQVKYLLQVASKKHRKRQNRRTHYDTERLPPAVRAVELSIGKLGALTCPSHTRVKLR